MHALIMRTIAERGTIAERHLIYDIAYIRKEDGKIDVVYYECACQIWDK